MPRGTRITAAQKQQIADLIRTGMGRNAVAAEAGVAAATVTNIAKAEGLSFDRTATEVAVKARRIDRAEVRADLIDRLYRRADKVLARLEAAEYTYRMLVGSGGGAQEPELVTDEAPPAKDERELSASIAQYLGQATRLEQVDGSGHDDAKSMLAELGRALGVTE